MKNSAFWCQAHAWLIWAVRQVGWCQVAVKRVNALGERRDKAVGTVLGVDLQEVEPIAGAEIHQLDFLAMMQI